VLVIVIIFVAIFVDDVGEWVDPSSHPHRVSSSVNGCRLLVEGFKPNHVSCIINIERPRLSMQYKNVWYSLITPGNPITPLFNPDHTPSMKEWDNELRRQETKNEK
jgi:hypothetical protein